MLKSVLITGANAGLGKESARQLAQKSGGFYASQKGLTGAVCEQGQLFRGINSETFQENAYQVIQCFVD